MKNEKQPNSIAAGIAMGTAIGALPGYTRQKADKNDQKMLVFALHNITLQVPADPRTTKPPST